MSHSSNIIVFVFAAVFHLHRVGTGAKRQLDTYGYLRSSTGWLADNSKEWHFLDRSYVTQRHISPKIHPSTTKSLFIVCFQKITKIDVQNGVPVVAVMNG